MSDIPNAVYLPGAAWFVGLLILVGIGYYAYKKYQASKIDKK